MDPVTGGAVQAGAELLGQGINAVTTGMTNRAQRKWSEKMYRKQREDSLADWNMQNNYNSPEAQMARLRAAGLNPNLVYGNGATNEAGAIRSSDVGTYNPRAPQFDLGSVAGRGLGAYYDMQIKDATLENLKQQNAVMQTEEMLKKAQTIATSAQAGKTTIDTKSSEFDLQMKSLLKEISYETAALGVDKLKADIRYTLNQDERARLSTNASLRENAERILNYRSQRATDNLTREQIRATINNLRRDGTLKDLETNLRENGINPQDPMYLRILGQILNGDSTPISKALKGMRNKVQSWFK